MIVSLTGAVSPKPCLIRAGIMRDYHRLSTKCQPANGIVDIFQNYNQQSSVKARSKYLECAENIGYTKVLCYSITSSRDLVPRLSWHDLVAFSILPKHLLQVVDNDIGSLPCRKVTSFVIVTFVNHRPCVSVSTNTLDR